ncbi:hypothetical protein [uncultured Chryseobacterium sp.]|uniref:hypothetical protein n=1 Tax=uncultured Chryseobacterium sp. TaxID=259322 RepID=UPI002600253A|nr:hypothetical protein [uncultured Chryseobacterium sp.]
MSEILNIDDFGSYHGSFTHLSSEYAVTNLLKAQLLLLRDEMRLISDELKIVRDNKELIRITAEKTEIKNRLYANNEYVSVPIGTVVAFAGRWIPEGWEVCDGGEIDWGNSDAIKIIGQRKPNLIDKFIRGTDSPSRDERGADEVALVAENLPWHNHAYYETRFSVGTKRIASLFNGGDAFYQSHEYNFVKRLTNNQQDSDDHRPSRLEARKFSIVPSHVTLRYIIKLI